MTPKDPKSTARKWTCDGCGVTASRIDGQSATEPTDWTNSKEGRYCLACRRNLAADAALAGAPAGNSRDECRLIRRTGLIEFEMRRMPNQSDGRIASACGTSPSTVAAVRREVNAAKRPSR